MVDLGGPAQALAAFTATARLQMLQHADEIARPAPQLPGDHAGRMPACFPVRAGLPKVGMPAETVDRLPAHAAGARTAREGGLPKRRRRRPKSCRQPFVAPAPQAPGPSGRRTAAGRKRARQPVGPHRVGAPIAVDREPRHRRDERAAQRPTQHRRRKDFRQGLFQARQGSLVSLVPPFRHGRTSPRNCSPDHASQTVKSSSAGRPPVSAGRCRGAKIASWCGPNILYCLMCRSRACAS